MKFIFLFISILFVNILSAQNKVDIEIKTGADNLEPKDFMENPSVTLRIRNKPDIVISDINHGRSWPNNSVHRITIPLTQDILVSDVSEIEITRKDKDGSKNNIEATAADNWNIDRLLVTATFKVNNKPVKYKLLEKAARPLVRFIYEKRGTNNPNETATSVRYVMDDLKIISGAPAPTPTNPNLVIAKPIKLVVEINTGDDDLRGGGDNVSLKIFLKNNPTPIQWKNLNANRKWNNYSAKRVEKTFNNLFDFDAIEKIEMWHDGGGGMGADNWTVDKVLITAKLDSRQKILVDRIGTPVHRFTGDTRRKLLSVE